MSFDEVIQAMKDDPALTKELQAAKTPGERAAILEARGIEKPTVDSQFPEMADVAGGASTTEITTAAVATSAASA